ncbi:acyltransferase [Caulobacter sp. S45]|uniref:acyltransferase family protein n=1 Tax=Caulobacter sp. S45 TaxID=1641861 RepID=UPI00131AF734|nr:acyltransferase [Caulobacter sp. S45]
MSEPDPGRAYRTLDGLRGVAALIVVTRHVGAIFPGNLFPESFLAVDLFFLLSGFVVAHAYEARLLAGRSLLSFMKTRLIRLYPLYLLGLGLGVVAWVATAYVEGGGLDPAALVQTLAVALLMLPALPLLPKGGSILDGPTWTLAPELAVNLVYAAAVKRLGRRALWTIVALSGAGLVAAEYAYGSLDEGWSAKAFPLLMARLSFSFFLGVSMFRLRLPRRCGPIAACTCLAVLAAALMARPSSSLRHLYELGAVMLAFPAIVGMAVQREPGRVSGALFGFLGAVSYAVYVLHHPLGRLVGLVVDRGQGVSVLVNGGLFLLGLVMIGALADHVYDRPLRRWLAALRFVRPARLRPDFNPGEA